MSWILHLLPLNYPLFICVDLNGVFMSWILLLLPLIYPIFTCVDLNDGFMSWILHILPLIYPIFTCVDLDSKRSWIHWLYLQCFGSVLNWTLIRIQPKILIRIQKTLNPSPDPSYFFTLKYLNIILNYFIVIPFYHQKKLIERQNVVKIKK